MKEMREGEKGKEGRRRSMEKNIKEGEKRDERGDEGRGRGRDQ